MTEEIKNNIKLNDHSLFPVWSQTVVTGALSYVVLLVLFIDVIGESFGLFVFFGILIDLLVPILMCIFIYLPIRNYDEKKLLNSGFNELLERYLPFFTLPFALIFIFVYLVSDQNSIANEALLIFISIYFVALASLFWFTKSIIELRKPEIKSYENNANEIR